MKEQKIIYYKDELNDEFSGAEITLKKSNNIMMKKVK